MKKAKLVKTNKKEKEQEITNSYSIKSLILISLVVAIIFGIFYLITYLVVDPTEEEEKSIINTELDSTKITVSQLLNRNEEEYYVLATKESLYNKYNSMVNYSELYNNYINNYSSSNNSLEFYYIDLDDALNSGYISDELNISNNLNEIKINDEILFKIKNSTIEEYYVGSSDILEALSVLKES